MNAIKWVVVAVAFAAAVVSARAQMISAASYIGPAGSGEIYVNAGQSEVSVFYFDRVGRFIELADGTVSANGTATLSTNYGRIVSLVISANSVSGTFVNVSFVATKVPILGPMANKARNYSGTFIDPTTGIAAGMVQRIFADGRVIVLVASANAGNGGIGSIATNNVITVPMAFGQNWTYLFTPTDGVMEGLISSPGLRPANFVLIEKQRGAIVNIATRGTVGGGNLLTAGFVVSEISKTLLIRAVGPTLGAFNVPNPQRDPVLTVYSGQTVIATNNDWGATVDPSEIVTASRQVGAFALGNLSKDSAMMVTLAPGAYTAQVTGTGPAGEALVEVYEVR